MLCFFYGTDKSVPYAPNSRDCIRALRLHKAHHSAILIPVMTMELQKRKLPRLNAYDYSTPGAYFITICTYHKNCIFGSIIPGDGGIEPIVRYSPIGEIAKTCLFEIEQHYNNVKIDNWVIMPNHIHILFRIRQQINPSPKKYDIPNVVGKYKASVTRSVGNAFMHSEKIWQSSYHDHIIRNDQDYQKIWEYISGNPSKWLEDCFYCEE